VATAAAALPPPAEARPEAPEGLTASTAELWVRVVGDYNGWSRSDLAVLTLAARLVDRAEACRQVIDTEGLTVGTRVHPLLKIELATAATIAGLFRQLGIVGVVGAPPR
jgi:hypothetical protein